MESFYKKFEGKDHQPRIKRKDLPKCPICGSEAFLNCDKFGEAEIKAMPEGSFLRLCFENYFKNHEEEKVYAGYSCGCKAYKPNDGIHNEPMVFRYRSRTTVIRQYLRKVDEIYARNEIQ